MWGRKSTILFFLLQTRSIEIVGTVQTEVYRGRQTLAEALVFSLQTGKDTFENMTDHGMLVSVTSMHICSKK